MGFFDSRERVQAKQQREECLAFLARLADQRIRMSTLEWLPGK